MKLRKFVWYLTELFRIKNDNGISAVSAFLKQLKVRVNKQTIKSDLENHPGYPSLLAISDCLTHWNIYNEAYKIPENEYEQGDLLFPFLAYLPEDNGRFIVVKSIEDGNVLYADEKHPKGEIMEKDFLQRWTGIMLHAVPAANSGENGYVQNKLKYSLQTMLFPASVISLFLILNIVFTRQQFYLPYVLMCLTKIIGIGLSILLLIQSVNANNPLIKNLCGLTGKNDCNAILKSDAAKITSWLSWSEVGFFYFTGTFILLLFSPASIYLLMWINLLCLPYGIYSVSYQYQTKNWCILCCAVQALLWLESITFLLLSHGVPGTLYRLDTISAETYYLLPLAFVMPIIIWAFLKPVFLAAAKLKPIEKQLNLFKYNSELFRQVLTNQPRYAVKDELMPIVLGNTNAGMVITMVSNPFCGPCSKAHEALNDWIKTREDIQLKIIFATANHDDDNRTKVARHITALSLLADKKLTEKALNEWYAQGTKKYEIWAEKYPVNFSANLYDVTFKQRNWCEMAGITATPTILVNGYKLPEPYRLEDLKYLIT